VESISDSKVPDAVVMDRGVSSTSDAVNLAMRVFWSRWHGGPVGSTSTASTETCEAALLWAEVYYSYLEALLFFYRATAML